jgi:YidC/Oxa1 family membrane protein insertase
MDNTRTVLVIALFLVLTLLWQAWEHDYGRLRPPAPVNTDTSSSSAAAANTATETQPPAQTPLPPTPTAAASHTASTAEAASVVVETDRLLVDISLRGGELSQVKLKDFPVAVDRPTEPMILLDHSEELDFVIQGGVLSDNGAPTHEDLYTASNSKFRMEDGNDELAVPLTWRGENGVEVTKTYVFKRGTHSIETRYAIHNSGSSRWTGRVYAQLLRHADKPKRNVMPTYTGAAISSPDKRYEKLPFKKLAETPLDRDITGGWTAILQHYFVAAIIPPPQTVFHYYSKALPEDRYILGIYGPEIALEPGASADLTLTNYAGPKDQQVLAKLAPGLDLTVDYGALWFIAKPLFWLLQKLHAWTGNWGWSIILLTLTVKAALFRLAAASYRSMAHMKRVQPRIQALRDRFGNDKQRLNQAMMELYKEEKINPLGGCLPVVLQIPVFLSLYWVLLESVELRQASFIGWIKDLSTYDPYFVLPLLMGASMLIQQQLNPTPPDPVQAKVMQIMPIIFTVFFLFFPSGLVLYWLVNNVLSIAQQWVITRKLEPGTKNA